jgi:hypothetical protein
MRRLVDREGAGRETAVEVLFERVGETPQFVVLLALEGVGAQIAAPKPRLPQQFATDAVDEQQSWEEKAKPSSDPRFIRITKRSIA